MLYMKLNYDRHSPDPTYFIQQGIRHGTKTTTKNVVRIGKHSELLKITDDPLEYAKEQVKLYNEEIKSGKTVPLEIKVNFEEKLKYSDKAYSDNTRKNIGYLYLQKLYHDLDIASFFKKYVSESKIEYDPNDVNRFLTFSRILCPFSKLETQKRLVNYYEQPKIEYVSMLRTMDILTSHYDEYITHLFEGSKHIVKRNTSVCYYDCSNYYFETECEDEDYVDEVTGEFIKGMRKYGHSKENRPNPIVEMGLFMDGDGIPLSMCICSGSDNEMTTAIPLEKKLSRMFNGKPFIYCADAGLGSYNIRKFNSMGGKAFVVTQSIKKMSSQLQEAVFNDCDYKLLSNNKPFSVEVMKTFDRMEPNNRELYNDKVYKVIDADVSLDLGLLEEKVCKNGNTRFVKAKGTLKQKIIITFSRKAMEYQRYIRNRQIERAKKLLENIDPDTYKKGPHDVTRFIKRSSSTKSGEKIAEKYSINYDLICEEEKYDGFYAVATNLDDDAKTVLNICDNRYKIEDCFRIMKTNFDARPVYHRKPERIIAHFTICYTALLLFRLLQKKLNDSGFHFSIDELIKTMRNMDVVNLDDVCYASAYTDSKVLSALETLFELNLNKKYYLPKELNKNIRQIS